MNVSGQSKPATKGRMKTSHFEGSIAYWAALAAPERNERTQRELAAFDNNFGGQRLGKNPWFGSSYHQQACHLVVLGSRKEKAEF